MGFNVLVVAHEKELEEFLPHVQAAKKYVGPIRIFKETRAVQACSQAQAAKAAGGLHAALLDNHFCAPGKAEFNDALRKVLKEQFHDTPVLCWGHPDKGGDKGKHYHHAVEEMNEVGPMLAQVKSGELVAEWKEKGEKKSLFGGSRKSVDKGPAPSPRPSVDQAPKKPAPRPSVDQQAPPKKAPEPAHKPAPVEEEAPAPRRRSTEGRSSSSHARCSKDVRPSMDLGFSGMGGGGMGMGMGGMGMPGMGSGDMGMMGGMNGMGMNGMGGMNGMNGMGGMSGPMSHGSGAMNGGMGMGGMNGMNGMGMAPAAPAMADPNMMMGGMNSFVNARPPQSMHMEPSMMQQPQQSYPMQQMAPPAMTGPQRHCPDSVIQQFSSQVNQNMGMQPMGGMGMGAPQAGMMPAGGDPSAMMAGMSVNEGSSNTALIRMLAEEVVTLRKALEEKNASRRASMEPNAAAAAGYGQPRPFQM